VGEPPLLVRDGSTRYLHAGGILAEVDAANAAFGAIRSSTV
jgi:hypothetical protein